ncbi:MAG: PIG-L family deacetylase [Parafilimonas sp.]|nr:PIG-L family deacetylase [Parafilimonas sp.]
MFLKKACRFLLISSVFISNLSFAQTPPSYNSADIYLQLKKLNVLGSVLYIAAHPDDENTRLLGYFSNGELYRTGYMSLTRGDGGQNLIGDEQGIELGLIRTQELLSARRIDGAEQFFSRAYDFGFSKSSDEALRLWNHDKILSDVVWVIRKFQPDVIITRFPGDARAGHGHHAASEILAKEAFTAAADPTKFPEQLQYVKPWQAKRILWNTFNFGGNNTTSDNQFKMDIGGYNTLLGKSYGEIAAKSRSQHKSQGFGASAQRGQSFEYFDLTAGEPVKNNLFDDVDTTWNRVANSTAVQQQVNEIIKSFQFEHPESSADALISLYKSLQQLPDSYWRNKKSDEVKNLIIECAGIYTEATSNNEFAVKQQKFNVQFSINKRLNSNAQLKEVKLLSFDSSVNSNLSTDVNTNFSQAFLVDDNMQATQPYWLKYGLDGIGSFAVKDQQLIGKPQNDPAFNASFTFTINGTDITVDKPVQYKFTDPVKGELYEPLIVVDPLSISLQPNVILTNIKDDQPIKKDEVFATIRSYIESVNTKLRLFFVQDKDSVFIKDTTVDLVYNQTYDFSFPLSKFYNKLKGEPSIAVEVNINNKAEAYNGDLHSIQYDHIPYIHYYATDKIHVVNTEVKTVGKHIGYIVGAGDKMPQSLQQMGYEVKILNENDITASNLKQFDAIITGVRAYNVHEWLSEKYNVLMNYIKDGGNLIVQYNTNNQTGSVKANIGPYNFTIGRTRVTEENADVHILLPNNPALNYPNKITDADFKNWIQERSTYHAEQFDEHYEAPLGMHDVNETESNGALIIAKYGKGNFVYAGIVFFRQLPAGAEGAYRLMANLIALPGNK